MSLAVGTLEHHDGSAYSIRSFRATVQLLEPIGSDTFVEFAVNGTTILARVAPDMPFEVGRTVQVEVTPSGSNFSIERRGSGSSADAFPRRPWRGAASGPNPAF